jgi:protein TonB
VDIPLSPTQLTQGKVVYVPTSGDLELVLSAHTASGVVQDSVRVIGSPIARPLDSGSRARALSQPSAPAAVVPAAPAAAVPSIDAALKADPAERAAPKPDLEPTMAAQLQPQQAQPITLRIETAPAPRVTPPPAATPIPDRPAPPPQAPVAVPRVLSQPVALSKVAPLVPPHLRSVLPGGATVDVQLRLGADGRVLSATAAPASGVMAHLSRLAVDAAKRWRFEPAKLDGRPVESDHRLTFRFGK